MISKSTRHIEPFGLLASATSPAWKSRTALNPFRTKAESLDILAFIHPPGDGAPSQLGHRFRGIGNLSNVIGNVLETSIALSHLISTTRSTAIRGSRSARRSAAGSALLRRGSDLGCKVRPDLCHGGI